MTTRGPESRQEPEFRQELVALLPRLRRFARALAGGRDAAEDLLQAAVERALVRSESFDVGRRLDSWMFKLMQNLWFDMRRSSAFEPLYTSESQETRGEDGRDVVESREDLRLAREAFDALPVEQRSVMSLVVLDGMSYADAAEALDVPIGTIMSRLARARASVAAHVRGPVVAPVRRRN